jgi:predicted thioredoxin/glutaredoxin
MSYGVMSTPALVIDGAVKAAGKVPKVEEIKNWIQYRPVKSRIKTIGYRNRIF